MITPRSTRIVMVGMIACTLIVLYRWSNALPCESGSPCPRPTAAPPCPRCKRYASDRQFAASLEEKEKMCKKRVGQAEISNQGSWSDISQEGEMTFWVEPSRWTAMVSLEHKAGFKKHYAKYFHENGGFDVSRDFRGQTVVDVGAGPRPLAAVFEDTTLYVIEPLGDRFLKLAKEKIKEESGEYLEIQKARKVYGRPAEEFVPELEGKCDVALSTNSLDHTWDPTKYLENMRRYLKPDGYVYLIIDLHIKTEPMHPQKSLLPSILDQAHAAGLRFERGECILPAAYPGFAFNSCWMILKKAVKSVDLYEGCEARGV